MARFGLTSLVSLYKPLDVKISLNMYLYLDLGFQEYIIDLVLNVARIGSINN